MTIVWSVSQSHVWNECRLQWWMRYVAHAPAAQPDAPNRVSGRAKHMALETAYNAVKDLRWHERGRTMESTLTVALEVMERYWREQDPDVDSWDIDRAAEEIGAVLSRLPMPQSRAIIGPELKFSVPVEESGGAVTLNGVIDLGLWSDLERSVHLRDWKSNTIPDTVQGNPQLAVYDYVIRRIYPTVRTVSVGLYSIRKNRETYGALDDPEHRVVRGVVNDAWEADAARYDAKQPGEEPLRIFAPTPSERACSGCPFRSYCPAVSPDATLPLREDPAVVAATREALMRRLDPVKASL